MPIDKPWRRMDALAQHLASAESNVGSCYLGRSSKLLGLEGWGSSSFPRFQKGSWWQEMWPQQGLWGAEGHGVSSAPALGDRTTNWPLCSLAPLPHGLCGLISLLVLLQNTTYFNRLEFISEWNWRWIRTICFEILCLWDLSCKYMRPLRIKFELKINLYRVKGLLFFICFSTITSVAVLSTTLACGGTELPFLMWAWASCQHGRGRSMAQRGISRAPKLTHEQANVSGNPFNLSGHMN